MCRPVVIFRGEIPQILLSQMMVELEDVLLLVVEEPKISHFHCSGALPLDGIIDNTHRRCVVDVDRDRRLRMPQFLQG